MGVEAASAQAKRWLTQFEHAVTEQDSTAATALSCPGPSLLAISRAENQIAHGGD